MKKIIFSLFLVIGSLSLLVAQDLKPGFEKEEYVELLKVMAQTNKSKHLPSSFLPENFRRIYTSPVLGLDNQWVLWLDDHQHAVIAIRGTIESSVSWMANLYAAMVPAKGKLTLTHDYVFDYELASHPQAAVHVGWLVATGFLAPDIVNHIDSCYKSGIKDFYIAGHSQGGAISFLVTSYLRNLQETGKLPQDIRFKTYCSAGPKPGNLYYAYAYELQTQDGWAYNVVNIDDCVPMLPFTVQTSDDFLENSPLYSTASLIKEQKIPHKVILSYIYKKLDESSRKALSNYQKFLGDKMGEVIKRHLCEYNLPEYYPSNNYVKAGNYYILSGDEEYYKQFSLHSQQSHIEHHSPAAYYYLLTR